MTTCYLRVGNDPLEDATRHETIADAKADFKAIADDLGRFGQTINATLHIAPDFDSVVEDPDYLLEIGPRGGLVCSRF